MGRRFFPVLLALCLLTGAQWTASLSAQTRQLGDWLRHYQSFSQNFAQEKVYLYFDNDNYLIGENIWFKAYVLMADNHHYSNMSKTLYVELLSSDGNLVDQLKLRVENGQADGCFYLKPQLSAGFYEVRAYTRCMLNFDENVIFSRIFPVMDQPVYDNSGQPTPYSMNIKKPVLPDKRPKSEGKSQPSSWQVDFYPEGGQLVAGRPNQLAFKASRKGSTANEEVFSASIVDENDRLLAVLQSEHLGMGSTLLNIEQAGKYYCVGQGKQGKFRYQLPAVANDGFSVIVNNQHPEVAEVALYTDQASREDTLAMLVTCRGRIYQLQAFVNNAPLLQFELSKRGLPTGVNELLVIDKNGRALLSRMFFVQNPLNQPRVLRIAQAQDKESYRAFEPAQVTLSVQEMRDSSWIALPGQTFAVTVRDDAEYLANAPQSDAYSQLLLASDLKGYIHQPSWYFEQDDRRHRHALDLLLMVQAWRRYDWQVMSHEEDFVLKHPIEKGILLDGEVLSVLLRKPMKNMKVLMWMIGDSTAVHGHCLTDDKGAFNFLLDFEGKQNLNLQVSDEKRRRNSFITINRQFHPAPRALSELEMQAPLIHKKEKQSKAVNRDDQDAYRELRIMPGDVLLKEVEVSAKSQGGHNQIGEISITYDTQDEMDVLQDNAMYTYDDIPTFLTQINANFHFRYQDGQEKLYYKHAPVRFVVMPAMRFYQSDSSDMPSCSEIERMEIMEPGAVSHVIENNVTSINDVSSMGRDVAYVVLYPYKDGIDHEDPVGIRRTSLQGYNHVKEFYHPQYDRILDTDPQDHRRTLYWNPSVSSDQRGQAKIRFYQSATSTGFEVHALVITPQGKLGWR